MKKSLYIFLSLLLSLTSSVFATTGGDDKNKEKSGTKEYKNTNTSTPQIRKFKSLETYTAPNKVLDNLNPEDFEEDLSDTLQQHFERALELEEYLKNNNRFVEVLDEKTLVDLPVGIKKEIGGLTYSISLDSIVMTPTSAYLIAYMVFEIPSSERKIAFRGSKIGLTKSGGISGGSARLELIGDQSMNLFSEKTLFTLKGDGSTFVEFDCNGYKSMGVGAEITFSRDVLIPDNGSESDRVKTNFTTTLSNWNDLVVEVEMPDFQVTKLKDVTFSIKDAVFDFSDYRNAPAIKFPEDYEHGAISAGLDELWRGFYLRELTVKLPEQFNKKGEGTRRQFSAYDVLIDNQGFTGNLRAYNLLQPKEGDMNGWSFSLDTIKIDVQANRLTSGSFGGELVIPISGDETPFEYSAIINGDNEYIFNISPSNDVKFEVFKTSKVELYEASYIEVSLIDGKFKPKANLHGKMSINAKLGQSESSKTASLADISFENLELQSEKPYIKVGSFGFGSEAAQQAMAGFPIGINNIGFKTIGDEEVSLDFDLTVNLNESFGGEAGLSILGEFDNEAGWQSWKYKKLQVNDIMVDIDQGAFKFYGKLTFFRNDATYGDGFNGVIDAEFKPGIEVGATAIFGSVSGMRYWYADAMAEFSSGIPIFTGVGIYGFGGGAYYRMKMDTEGVGSEFGRTNSGIVYVPDADSGLGLKASVTIGSHPSKKAFNGDATFEMSFFKGGGLRYIAFSGNAYLMTPALDGSLEQLQGKVNKVADAASKLQGPDTGMLSGVVSGGTDNTAREIYGEIGTAAGKRGQLSASMMISYDFENRVLHGNMEMYVNVAGGIIKGVGPGGRAGWAVIHFAPEEWYIYVGTPDDRIGVSAGIGPIRAELTSYFMIGTKIPGSPPPPEIVSDILGGIDLDYMKDENALGMGQGVGFGAAFAIDTGDLSFLMFYARFQAGMGFDIMLKNYGDDVACKGRSEPLGINGWYANGQAYAYFDGKVGIRVKIFGKRKSVEILSIGAAAVLQAKLPNPFWMRGIVGGRFSVLGGLVKGNCRFEVTIGEECEIVGGSVLQGIQVIAEVTPNDGEKDISVFNTPQAVFNMEINKNFEMIDLDDKKKVFRIKLDEFSLINNGSLIPGELEWNDQNDVVAFNSFDVFPSEKDLKALVQVSFEEKVGGQWVPVYVDGAKYVEKEEVKFRSGVAPDYIPLENVEYSYPIISQVNLYKNETDKGYIKLVKGQPYLFEVDEKWIQKGRFKGIDGSTRLFNFNYSSSSRQINFEIPSSSLKNDLIYAFELVNLPASSQGSVDRNVSSKSNKLLKGDQEIDTEVTTKEAEGNIDELQEKSIYATYLRTSRYSTLSAKLNAADMSQQWRWPIRNGVHELGKAIEIEEVFDNAELNGANNQDPLIQFEAVLSDNRYYDEYMYPIVYNGYPLENRFKIDWRDPIDEMGVPPVRAVFIRQHPTRNIEIDDVALASGSFSFRGIQAAFIYNLSHYYQKDMSNLQNQVATYYADSGNVSERIQNLLTSSFPRILGGPYKVKVNYVLPGTNEITSTKTITITNPVE